MPFRRSRGYEALQPETTEHDDHVAPEVPTSFATKGLGWSGRDKDELKVIDLNEEEKEATLSKRRTGIQPDLDSLHPNRG